MINANILKTIKQHLYETNRFWNREKINLIFKNLTRNFQSFIHFRITEYKYNTNMHNTMLHCVIL